MTTSLILLYVGGWLTTTAIALMAATGLRDRRHGPRPPSIALVSLIAGAFWPVLVVGAAEVGGVVSVAKLKRS